MKSQLHFYNLIFYSKIIKKCQYCMHIACYKTKNSLYLKKNSVNIGKNLIMSCNTMNFLTIFIISYCKHYFFNIYKQSLNFYNSASPETVTSLLSERSWIKLRVFRIKIKAYFLKKLKKMYKIK